MQVRNEELRTTRELARETNSIIDALARGDVEKVVVTQSGRLRAVILSVERFEMWENGVQSAVKPPSPDSQ